VELSGGGLFLDLGSHAVDLIDYLCGPLQDVHGHARRRAPSAGDGAPEDTVSATFSTESGALGALVYSFHTAQVLDELEIVGDRGRLVCSLFGSEPLQWHTDRGVERVPRPHPEHVQEPLIQSMVDELSGRGPGCPSTGQSALRASAAMDRMLGDYYGGRDDAFWARRESWPLGR
jgi:predicted dehydrogenase